MPPRTLFLVGLVLGAVLGLGFLLAGPLTLVPGLVVWTWVFARRPRFVAGSGGLIGFGFIWLLLLGQATYRCANDASCTQPDMTGWFSVGIAIVIAGVWLALVSLRRSPTQPSTRTASCAAEALPAPQDDLDVDRVDLDRVAAGAVAARRR